MIASMTGFGRGSVHQHGITATVEMRSVNNRFLDVVIRLPQHLADREADIQNRLKTSFERGRLNVQIQVEQEMEAELPIQVNPKAARAYGRLLKDLQHEAGLETPASVEALLKYSNELFTVAEASPEAVANMWAVVQMALEEAIDGMQLMRQQEGYALEMDFQERINLLEEHLEKVEARAPERVQEARERLQSRIAELLGDSTFDVQRLEYEIAILADRLDVSEECVRLRSHLSLFREALAGDESAGRKLNFLIQEIHREVNTIGSKSNDAQLARITLSMKEEVEKMREQIQNVE